MYENVDHLDVIVNNACQTVRRPPAFYRHLVEGEVNPPEQLPQVVRTAPCLAGAPAAPATTTAALMGTEAASAAAAGTEGVAQATALATAPEPTLPLDPASQAALSTQVAVVEGDDEHDLALFPEGVTDVNDQQLDLRRKHSWVLKLEEVSTGEAAEVG